MFGQNAVRLPGVKLTFACGIVFAAAGAAAAADDGPVVGVVRWEPGERRDANSYDKTDFWACISYSPSTGKFGSSCNWTADINAKRQSRDNCNAKDAKPVVMCCNGWCSLALGDDKEAFGVGWGADRQTAEKFALQSAKERTKGAKVVFSINAREPRCYGSIAFSESTGKWGYASGGGRSSEYRALKFCNTPDAKVIATKFDCWLALAVGDDKSVYGFGFAGNRADAEKTALEECAKRTTNAKVQVSFCSNGVEY